MSSAAAIHDGDPYTEGLARAFADAFEAGGGTLTGFTAVNKGDTDMVPVLTEVAAGSPDMLFFPIFQPEGNFIIQQSATVSGLGNTIMMAADGLLNSNYLAVAETEGMYFTGPDVRYGTNFNESTGESAFDVLTDYQAEFGEAPAAPFWAHSYDAAVLLMDAIAAASYDDGGTLVIDRAGVREYLDGVSNYSGLIGSMSCDAFGDCSSAKIIVIQNIDIADYAASTANVVYEYAPLGGRQAGAPATTRAPVTTRAPASPYGIGIEDLETLLECFDPTIEVVDLVSVLAEVAGEASTFDEFGLYFQFAQDEFLTTYLDTWTVALLCQAEFPRLYGSVVSDISDWIDACALVSDFSSTSTDDRCARLLEDASDELERFTSRLDEATEWIISAQ